MSKTPVRIYEVKDRSGAQVALVEASSKAQVFAHIGKTIYTVTPATGSALYEAGKSGLTVEPAIQKLPAAE